MRFVDVNPFFYPHHGGIETRMHDTARLLAARGHDVTILTGRLPDTPEEEMTDYGYRVVRLPSRLINIYNPPFISSKGVLEALESMDADVVNYNYRWAPSYNKDLKRYDGGKVFTYHNMWGEGIGVQARLSEINDNGFRSTLDTFDHIVCVSDYVRDDLIRRGIPAERLTTIPTCMDMPPLRDVPEGDYILSLGRLVATKGLSYLIDAMEEIDCRLVLCGKGRRLQTVRHAVALRIVRTGRAGGHVPREAARLHGRQRPAGHRPRRRRPGSAERLPRHSVRGELASCGRRREKGEGDAGQGGRGDLHLGPLDPRVREGPFRRHSALSALT